MPDSTRRPGRVRRSAATISITCRTCSVLVTVCSPAVTLNEITGRVEYTCPLGHANAAEYTPAAYIAARAAGASVVPEGPGARLEALVMGQRAFWPDPVPRWDGAP